MGTASDFTYSPFLNRVLACAAKPSLLTQQLYMFDQTISTTIAVFRKYVLTSLSDVICQMSFVRCQLSDVNCQMSFVRCQIYFVFHLFIEFASFDCSYQLLEGMSCINFYSHVVYP